MFCKHCGSQIADGVKFCPVCGKQTGAAAAPNTQPNTQPNAQPSGSTSGNTSAQQTYTYASAGNAAQKMHKAKAHMPSSASGVKYKKHLNIGNILVWVGCVVTLISLFTTFISASALGMTESATLVDLSEDTPVVFLFTTAIVIIAVVNLLRLDIATIVVSVLNLSLTILMLVLVKEQMDQYGMFSNVVSYGPGRMLLILGSLLMLGGGIAALILHSKAKRS